MFSSLIANSLVGAGQWRWIYWISLILNVLGGAGIVIFYKPPPRPEHEKSIWHQFIRLDWLGIFLFLTGLTLFLLGIFFGAKATTYAWNTAKVIACMVHHLQNSNFRLWGCWYFACSFSGKYMPLSNIKSSLQHCSSMSVASTCFASICLSPDRSFMQ
jgi:hypothetical protein